MADDAGEELGDGALGGLSGNTGSTTSDLVHCGLESPRCKLDGGAAKEDCLGGVGRAFGPGIGSGTVTEGRASPALLVFAVAVAAFGEGDRDLGLGFGSASCT